MTAVRPQTKVLSLFIFLQCLDLLTTLVFISEGLTEGNPIVNWALSYAHAPWVGLIVTKLTAGLIGQYCYTSGRTNLLRRANLGYSLVVGWNLMGIGAAVIAH
jgi:hypothetical protein